MAEITSLQDAKKKRERERYNALVLKAWDDQEHREERDRREVKAEIERKGRERL